MRHKSGARGCRQKAGHYPQHASTSASVLQVDKCLAFPRRVVSFPVVYPYATLLKGPSRPSTVTGLFLRVVDRVLANDLNQISETAASTTASTMEDRTQNICHVRNTETTHSTIPSTLQPTTLYHTTPHHTKSDHIRTHQTIT